MTILDAAKAYRDRQWMPVPIPYRSKRPDRKHWEQMRLTADELPSHFTGKEQNIGILLGEPSGWLIDVDLDHPRAVEIAGQYLPPTPAIFGRESKRRSHWIYRSACPAVTRKLRSRSAGMIVEFRSTGCQTVFPPSTHESGELIEWEDPTAEPATVDPNELLTACEALADAVRVELGEKRQPKPKKVTEKHKPEPAAAAESQPVEQQASAYPRCLAALRRIGLVDKSDGSLRLFTAACRCVEYGLADEEAVRCIREYAESQPFPYEYSDSEILDRLYDAGQKCERGSALEVDEEGLVKLGNRDPDTGRLVLSPRRTLPTAHAFVREFCTHPDGATSRCYAGILMEWRDNHFVAVEDGSVRNRLQPWLHDALRYIFDKQTGECKLVDFESNPGTVGAALETIRNYLHLPASITPPVWLIGPDGLAAEPDDAPDPREILSCRTLNLHIPTGTVLPATPALFTTSALDFDFKADAPSPVNWLAFLNQLWGGDAQSIELLQDWFGYVLTADTSQQKMLLLVGPRRSGKGTIARVLARLVGHGNIVGPTTSSLAGTFGLQPLIGKSLAIVSDARFSGDNIQTVVERLLCISGEDGLTIDRKHMPAVTMRLPTRFMFLTNELPRLTDSSGALAGRFLVLRLTQSFFGKEDPGLTDKLLAELPGILLWALQGWLRLRSRGRFAQPASADQALCDLQELSSPVGTFVQECCTVAPGRQADARALYKRWKEYCADMGRDHPGTIQSFARDLHAAVPGLITRFVRDGSGRARIYQGISLLFGV